MSGSYTAASSYANVDRPRSVRGLRHDTNSRYPLSIQPGTSTPIDDDMCCTGAKLHTRSSGNDHVGDLKASMGSTLGSTQRRNSDALQILESRQLTTSRNEVKAKKLWYTYLCCLRCMEPPIGLEAVV